MLVTMLANIRQFGTPKCCLREMCITEFDRESMRTKPAEEAIKIKNEELEAANEELRRSEEKLKESELKYRSLRGGAL